MSQRAEKSAVILPKYLLSDVVFAVRSYALNIVKKSSSSTFRTDKKIFTNLGVIGRKVFALLSKWTLAMAAPLRRIVARDFAVTMPDARNSRYRIYSLIDTLECGHEYSSYLFGGLEDLTFAYTDNPVIRGKRHRCRPCASLLAKKRPQSVPLAAAVKTA